MIVDKLCDKLRFFVNDVGLQETAKFPNNLRFHINMLIEMML